MRATLIVFASLAGSAFAGPCPEGQREESQTERKPIWAEKQGIKEYSECLQKYNGNKACVRELFHLQGSVGRFRMNCQGDKGDLQGQLHHINLSRYPKDMFPDGPQCGTQQGYAVTIDKPEYLPVCKECFGAKSQQ
jgi:hypothetical protein